MARAKTADEAREEFLDNIRFNVKYWLNQNATTEETVDGVVFSIMNIFDGTSMNMPSLDIVLRPHADDKDFHIALGENYFEDGQVINDCMLHEQWCNKVG